jgi:hypothetical protein
MHKKVLVAIALEKKTRIDSSRAAKDNPGTAVRSRPPWKPIPARQTQTSGRCSIISALTITTVTSKA